MKAFRKIVVALMVILFPIFLKGQVNRASLIGAYSYNFALYTNWPAANVADSFSLVLISQNHEVKDELIKLSQSKTIKGKPIHFNWFSSFPEKLPVKVDMVILTSDMVGLFSKVNQLISDLPILLVTENCKDKYRVMINLYDSPKQELVFEVNKANVINHKLTLNPEILLLGGNEIDVAALYRTSQKSIDSLQKEMNKVNDSLNQLRGAINQSKKTIEEQNRNIDSQKEQIDAHDKELKDGRIEIEQFKAKIIDQQELVAQQQELLKTQKNEMSEHQIELEEQQAYIKKQLEEIRKSKTLLDSLNTEVEFQRNELGHKVDIIKKQRTTIVLTIVTILLALIVLFSLIGQYINKSKKNKLLVQQKEQIEKFNTKLEKTNKSLYDTITKLHETQSQLVSSEKMASLGVLTAGIAHEINNPVNFIYTGINSLSKDMDELTAGVEEIRKVIGEKGDKNLIEEIDKIINEKEVDEILEIIPQTISDIKVGAERAADIIKGLRNFSRLDKDAMQFSNIHEGIESALLLLRNKFKNHIVVKKEYSQIPSVECYPGKLNQAFLNILSNAIDAIEKEGTIYIRTWNDKQNVYVQIEDSGKGIDAENLGKIFDPFFTTKSVGKGVGLGLSITYGIIHEHHGHIDVKSELNSGTIFTISLPCIT